MITYILLYMVPGMEHCFNGPGASAFRQFAMETSKGPKYGFFDSLENWLEKRSRNENVIATKYEAEPNGDMKASFTRPLCAYPKVARYTGSGGGLLAQTRCSDYDDDAPARKVQQIGTLPDFRQ